MFGEERQKASYYELLARLCAASQSIVHRLERLRMKRDNLDLSITPPDLREAEELLIRYGLWAQDRYKKRRCASAEGQYRAPPTPGEEPMPELMADFAAMDVQRALQVVPRQYSRVLAAVYIPKAESELSARLRMGIKRRLWHDSRVQGLRLFWGHYLRRVDKK